MPGERGASEATERGGQEDSQPIGQFHLKLLYKVLFSHFLKPQGWKKDYFYQSRLYTSYLRFVKSFLSNLRAELLFGFFRNFVLNRFYLICG